jgi:hypothetical protein
LFEVNGPAEPQIASVVMAGTDNDTGAGNGTAPQQPTVADLEPGTLGWRVCVAMGAHGFFKTLQDPGNS